MFAGLIGRPWVNLIPFLTDVKQCLIVDHESAVGMLERRVGGQHRVVGFDHWSRHFGCWIHCELQLGLFAEVERQVFHEKRSEPAASSASETMENEEPLQSSTLVGDLLQLKCCSNKFDMKDIKLSVEYLKRSDVCYLPNLVDSSVYELFPAHCVISPGIVIGRILLPSYHLVRVEQGLVFARPQGV